MFLAATAAFLLGARGASAQTLVVNAPRDGFLNLRTGPGTRYRVIRRMRHGSRVNVLARSGRWAKVRHQSGAVGWCYRPYLVQPARAGNNWRQVYSPGDGYLNLRTGPGTRYRIIRRMYNGEQVKLLARRGRWFKVRHQSGAVGWAYGAYLVR
jgi:N-acetylmuramoyl-L-alanine amidase